MCTCKLVSNKTLHLFFIIGLKALKTPNLCNWELCAVSWKQLLFLTVSYLKSHEESQSYDLESLFQDPCQKFTQNERTKVPLKFKPQKFPSENPDKTIFILTKILLNQFYKVRELHFELQFVCFSIQLTLIIMGISPLSFSA